MTATVLTDASSQAMSTIPAATATTPATIWARRRAGRRRRQNCMTPANNKKRPAKMATSRTLAQMLASTTMPKTTATMPMASSAPHESTRELVVAGDDHH